MRSDNGTNLVGTEKEMCEAIKSWNRSIISDAHAERHYLDIQPTNGFTFQRNLGEADMFCEENIQPNSKTSTS